MCKYNCLTITKKSLFIRMAAMLLPMLCAVLLLSQTAMAQNTYVITDGKTVLVHTTYATDPAAVLDEAGLALDEDDTYTAQAGEGVSEITVQRNQTIHIDCYGAPLTADSYGETVGELLARIGVIMDSYTAVSVPLDTRTFDGMRLLVYHTVRSNDTYTVSLPYNTIRCNDPLLPAGMEVVLTSGSDGTASVTDSVVYVNGKESSRTNLSQDVTCQPVDEVIAVGTGADTVRQEGMPVIGTGIIITPEGELLTYTDSLHVTATAYSCGNKPGITFTGTVARVGAIAVDPRVIPYGTRMYIVSDDGEYIYGIATAEDCGGLIKGNKVDLYFNTFDECWIFGVRGCQVYILSEE